MTVASIIAMLIQLFGPLLVEALKKWLDSILNKAAKAVYGENFDQKVAVAETATTAVIQKAIELTPRAHLIKRAILRHMLAAGPKAVVSQKLDEKDKKEIRALAKLEA